ncbi:MAG: single-stranded-DNA-specific exonuclease RecJ, partial [Bryobacteraceae bacterium]
MKPARWLLPAFDPKGVSELAEALRIRPLTARVLIKRGYGDPAAAHTFLHPSLDDLHDPHGIRDLDVAVERLRRAIAGGEKILIYGDYDVDGTTSVVILLKAIEIAGGTARYHVPHRLREGYGMRLDVVEQAAAEGVRLIISVDTGIRAGEVVQAARELGIDVIVTDHHLPEASLPPAVAVLNPNRPDCQYPNKNLCGAGVAFKLAQGLFETLGWSEEKLRRMKESFLRLAAIATVSDVTPLTGENRVIVKHGLRGLGSTRNPGLRALFDVSGFPPGETPTATQIAFRIGPRINAAGRMATATDVIELLLSADETKAKEIAGRLHSLNQERQETEAGIVRLILQECEAAPIMEDQSALVFSGVGWHRGVVGIVASRLVERFCRPVFVISEDAETGEAHGSGRSAAGFHLLEALESMPELFTKFGGHRQAAGVTIPTVRVEEFRTRFAVYARARLSPEDFHPLIEIDSDMDLAEA